MHDPDFTYVIKELGGKVHYPMEDDVDFEFQDIILHTVSLHPDVDGDIRGITYRYQNRRSFPLDATTLLNREEFLEECLGNYYVTNAFQFMLPDGRSIKGPREAFAWRDQFPDGFKIHLDSSCDELVVFVMNREFYAREHYKSIVMY